MKRTVIKMKIWVVAEVEETFSPNVRHMIELFPLHYSSTFEKAIDFLYRARKDENSGIEDDTVIDICEDLVDEYFSSETRTIGRQTLKEWLASCLEGSRP